MNLSSSRIQHLGALLLLVGIGVFFFFETLGPGKSLYCSDANIGHMAYTASQMPGSFAGRWVENGLVGNPSYMPLKLSSILLLVVPARIYLSLLIPLELILGSWFLLLFLRGRGMGWSPALFGAVAAFWLGSNLTLIYAGHLGKFGVICFSALSLWLIDLAARRKSPLMAVLVGAAVGQAFMEQADVALLFGIFLGAYAVYACIRECGREWVKIASLLAPMGLVALLFAFGPLYVGYTQNVKSATIMEADSNPEEKWNFVTQWSWPPGESIEFVAPGYFGWRTGEPDGPYWGKLGRSEGWETDGEGFMNFKLENHYLSLLTFLLAVAAIGFAGTGRNKRDVVFWGVAALIALFLSFGKFSVLYRLAYLLPGISYVRAPVKFLQVFQFALAILAAFGLDAYLRAGAEDDASKGTSPVVRRLRWVFLGVTGVLAFLWMGGVFAADTKIGSLRTMGWPLPTAELLVSNIGGALRHAVVIGAIGTGFAFAMARKQGSKWRPWLAVLLIVVLTGDAYLLSRRYVKAVDTVAVQENELARVLAREQGTGRCHAVDQNAPYNAMLTLDFPYHGLEFFNVTQMPRMAEDNKQFLAAFGRNIVALWQLAAVQTLVLTDPTWQQLMANPGLGDWLTPLHRFNLSPRPDGGIRADILPPDGAGGHLVVRSKLPASRYSLFTDWKVVPAAEALQDMQKPGYAPMRQPIVSGELPSFLEGVAPLPSPPREVQVLSHEAHRRRLKVTTEVPGVLRVSERYHPDWKATVGGEPAEVLRCDHLFQAVCVPAGIHEVTLTYSPSTLPLRLQAIGYGVVLLVGGFMGAGAVRARKRD